MSEFTDEETRDYFNPNGQTATDDDETSASWTNYEALFDAPDFATLVKGSRSTQARAYELRVKSVLKTGAIGALRRDNLADAAAIFEYGPAFSAAAGDLADKSERTRQMIDLLTAPENPYVALAMIAVPFVAQLFRNHQPAIQQVQRSRREMKKLRKENPEAFAATYPHLAGPQKKNVEIKLPFGRRLSLRVSLKVNPLRMIQFGYYTQTHDPDELTSRVFSDTKLVAALKKQGINIVQTPMPTR